MTLQPWTTCSKPWKERRSTSRPSMRRSCRMRSLSGLSGFSWTRISYRSTRMIMTGRRRCKGTVVEERHRRWLRLLPMTPPSFIRCHWTSVQLRRGCSNPVSHSRTMKHRCFHSLLIHQRMDRWSAATISTRHRRILHMPLLPLRQRRPARSVDRMQSAMQRNNMCVRGVERPMYVKTGALLIGGCIIFVTLV